MEDNHYGSLLKSSSLSEPMDSQLNNSTVVYGGGVGDARCTVSGGVTGSNVNSSSKRTGGGGGDTEATLAETATTMTALAKSQDHEYSGGYEARRGGEYKEQESLQLPQLPPLQDYSPLIPPLQPTTTTATTTIRPPPCISLPMPHCMEASYLHPQTPYTHPAVHHSHHLQSHGRAIIAPHPAAIHKDTTHPSQEATTTTTTNRNIDVDMDASTTDTPVLSERSPHTAGVLEATRTRAMSRSMSMSLPIGGAGSLVPFGQMQAAGSSHPIVSRARSGSTPAMMLLMVLMVVLLLLLLLLPMQLLSESDPILLLNKSIHKIVPPHSIVQIDSQLMLKILIPK